MLASKEELDNVVESILFVSGQGIEIKDIAEKLELNEKDIEKSIENLKEKHKNDGINIITFKSSVQMCSNPNYSEDISTVLNPIKEKLLTKAAMETAAIVAYKQPVTRLDIEQIRGVNSDYALQVLMNFKLIEVVGRKDAVGKPLLFGTTNEFLKRFELQNIKDLPDYDELLERIEILHKNANDALYGSTEIVAEENLPEGQDLDEIVERQIKSKSLKSNEKKPEKEIVNQNKELEQYNDLQNIVDNKIDYTEQETKDILNSSNEIDDNLNDVLDSKDNDLL